MVSPTVREAKNRRSICQKLADVFSRRGFVEVDVPLLQPLEVLEPVIGPRLIESCFKVIDHQGRVLCLQPDFTASLAVMAKGDLSGEARPLRFSYCGSAFRRSGSGDGIVEVCQAGLEIVGASEGEADAECIAVALEALREVGIVDVHVALGHAGVLREWLKGAGLDNATLESTRRALSARDLVALEGLLGQAGSGLARSFLSLLDLRGGLADLEEAMPVWERTAVGENLESLRGVYRRLESMGLCGGVFVDAGLLKDLDYYTGPVFDIYVKGLGEPVAGGGRYDELLGRIGAPEAAIGFACNIGGISRISCNPISGISLLGIH